VLKTLDSLILGIFGAQFREWACVECELEKCDFLLRDRIADLIGSEKWEND